MQHLRTVSKTYQHLRAPCVQIIPEQAFRAVVGEKLFPKLMSARNRSQLVAASLGGQVYVAENVENKIVAVALWFPPGREIYDRYRKENLTVGHD